MLDMEFVLKFLKENRLEGEIFYQEKEKHSLTIYGGEVEKYQVSKEQGIGIRILKNNKQGFSYTTDIKNVEEAINRALAYIDYMPIDENWSLVKEVEAKDIKKYMEDPPVEEKINTLKEVEKKIYSKDKRIKTIRNVVWEKICENNKIINTLNTFLEYNYQYQYVYTEVSASDGNSERSGFEFETGRTWYDLNFDNLVDKVVWKATSLLGAEPTLSKRTTILLPSDVASDFLELLSDMFNADNVQKNKSLLKGLLNQKVASPVLSIIEDPADERSLVPRVFDDEGVKTYKKYLIEDGILKEYLHNLYTANKERRNSTGNGVRLNFKSLPKIAPFNMYIKPGNRTEKSIISSVKDGIYIISLMGLHLADTVSGDFSLGIEGLQIKDGEFYKPLAEMTIAGNLKDLLNSISEVGSELYFKGNVVSPLIKLEDVMVSGK